MNNHIQITVLCPNCKETIVFDGVKASLDEMFIHKQCQSIMRIISAKEE